LQTKYLFHTPQGSLTCRKISRHGTDGFTSPAKEVVLWILWPLKIHRTLSGLNTRTLDPMARTITTTLPRPTWHLTYYSKDAMLSCKSPMSVFIVIHITSAKVDRN
jgi:hypothetical protein